MRDEIRPIWEDNNNINGGCWSFKVVKKDIYQSWIDLSISLIGETLSSLPLLINGISISPKKGFCIIKIWNKDSTQCETSLLKSDLTGLNLQESIYKSFQ